MKKILCVISVCVMMVCGGEKDSTENWGKSLVDLGKSTGKLLKKTSKDVVLGTKLTLAHTKGERKEFGENAVVFTKETAGSLINGAMTLGGAVVAGAKAGSSAVKEATTDSTETK